MTTDTSLKNLFKKLCLKAKEENFYSDVNLLTRKGSRQILFKENSTFNKEFDKGVKIRIWDGDHFLEFGTSRLEEMFLEKKFEELLERAKKNSETYNEIRTLPQEEELEKTFKTKEKEHISTLDIKEKTKKLHELKEKVLGIDSSIVNVRVGVIHEEEEHSFISAQKHLDAHLNVVILILAAFVKTDEGPTKMAYQAWTGNGIEVFDIVEKEFNKIETHVHQLKKAKYLEGGKRTVLLSPTLSGLLAHESFGHGMEADTMMKGRALASEWIGKEIGSPEINIVDYPAIEGKHGEAYFDYEGHLARKVYLVKEGKINEPMADLYSQNKLKLNHAASSRIESYDHKHYVRMSNTYFEPGTKSKEELISEIKEGIYVSSASGGMEDPKGWGVQLQGCFGQRIMNGKLVDEFYDGFSITGFLPDIIKNIKGISKDFEIQGAGMCGKGHKEYVRVSDGGPYLLIQDMILG